MPEFDFLDTSFNPELADFRKGFPAERWISTFAAWNP